MKKLLGAVLLLVACVGLVFAQTKKPTAAPATKAPSVSDAIKQLEHDWADGMKANDTEKVGAILASDWTGLSADGEKQTKTSYLADFASGASKITSFEFGPMHVRVVGNVAICQGSDTEKSTSKGKDTSGEFVWMDVFAKIDGKWQAIASEVTKVKK
jgi:ketosteroid isomerase-like protein